MSFAVYNARTRIKSIYTSVELLKLKELLRLSRLKFRLEYYLVKISIIVNYYIKLKVRNISFYL